VVDQDRIAVVRNQRVERLDQGPPRTVDHRLWGRVNVLRRAVAPFLAARYEFEFHDSLRTEGHRDDTARILRCGRHEHADRLLQRGLDLGTVGPRTYMRRADFLFAFGDQDEIDRHL